MSYEVEITEPAKKQLRKLEREIQERISAALERIRIRPDSYVSKLVGDNSYKLRVGDYRIIMEINRAEQRILVHKVAHRKNVYDFIIF